MNKRASQLDWFFIIPILFLIGVCIMTAFIIIDKTSTINVFTSDTVANNVVTKAKATILSADNIMLFVIIGLSLFVLVSSANVYNHPAFFIVGFFLLCIAITVSAVMSNAWWSFTANEQITTAAIKFPKITFLFENLPIYILFMGMAASIAAYVSYRNG